MYKDLDFEFPHKVHIQKLKKSLISDLNKEEQKFKDFETHQSEEKLRREEEERRRAVMTYEKYFGHQPNCNILNK